MDKDSFYQNKSVVDTEHWLEDCSPYPNLHWARLRVFTDGSADVMFLSENKAYGFDSKTHAIHFLSEDEYVAFYDLEPDERTALNLVFTNFGMPQWPADPPQTFEYCGRYGEPEASSDFPGC